LSILKEKYYDIWLRDKDGNEYLYTILFYLKSEITHRFIAVATHYDLDNEGNIRTIAFYNNPKSSSGKIEYIDNESDWELIERFLRYYQSPFKWLLVNLFLKRSL
jgi:uncharacterized protein YrzB (UPF0473 family)